MVKNPNELSELPKSKEVFTDSAEFVGQHDQERLLEAYTVSCGVVTLDSRENNVAGILHLSEGGRAEEVLGEAIYKAKLQGLQLSDFSLRRFKGSETIWKNAEQAFSKLGLKLPPWEVTMEPGIRIDKNTGEVEFYT